MISIIIPYYNRKQLLFNTLKSIRYFKGDHDIETIIVDDGSDKEHHIYNVKKLFPELNINLIVLERDSKWRGACIAYNIGFKNATGDIVLINSAECLHVGYILNYVINHLTAENYISFATYEGNAGLTYHFCKVKWDKLTVLDDLMKILIPFNNNWQSRTRKRKELETYIPFCAAIYKSNMIKLSGYDERFVDGIGYDDYDFTDRIQNLGLEREIIDEPFVVHQWHPPTVYSNEINLNLLKRLRIIYPERTKAVENKVYLT